MADDGRNAIIFATRQNEKQWEAIARQRHRIDTLYQVVRGIAPGSINAAHLAEGAVTAPALAADSVTTDHLQAGSVRANNISAGAISAGHIAAWSINAGHIQALSINTGHLQAGSVTANEILAGSINAAHITANAISAGAIQAGVVNADHLAAGSIETDKIQAGAITADKIASNAILADKIQASAITADKIAAGSITGDHLAANVTISSMLRTATSGTRMEIDANGIRGYKGPEPATQVMNFNTVTGSMELAGILTAQAGSTVPITYITSGNIVSGTIITIDAGGYLQTSPDSLNRVVLDSGGLRAYQGSATPSVTISSATASITGGTFETATPGSANRVVLDSAGLRGYASDGITERINISSGSATITAGTFKTAPSGSRVEVLGSDNSLRMYSGVTQMAALDPVNGLNFAVSTQALDSAIIGDNRLSTWRQSMPSGTSIASAGGVRYSDGSGTWNWGVLISKVIGSENTGAQVSAGDIGQARGWMTLWNQPSAGSNKRRFQVGLDNDANSGTRLMTFNGSDGSLVVDGLLRTGGYIYPGSSSGGSQTGAYFNYDSGNDALRANGAGLLVSGAQAAGRIWGNQSDTNSVAILGRHTGAAGGAGGIIQSSASGIGTSSVYSFFTATNTSRSEHVLRGDGVIFARNTAVQSLSDGTLKKNIDDLGVRGRDVIMALRPVTFDWRDAKNENGVPFGFVAQEVAQVLPEIVDEWDGKLTVGSANLIPHIVSFIQDHEKEISSLKQQVKVLTQRLDKGNGTL